MLDLKAKLAAAGLVSPEELKKAEARGTARGTGRASDKGSKRGSKGRARGKREASGPLLDVAALTGLERGKQYDAIRRFVDAARLDPIGRTPTERARTFHFPTESGTIGRLVVEPHVSDALARGQAGVVAFMSNHGLAHAVVSAEGARAIAELFPGWLRALADPHAASPEAGDEPT